MQPVKIAADCQERQSHAFERLTDADDCLAVELVRNMPYYQHEQKHRQELHETDHAQRKGAVGEGIDLPADRHSRHLEGYGGADSGDPETRIGAFSKDRPSANRLFLVCHSLLTYVRPSEASLTRRAGKSPESYLPVSLSRSDSGDMFLLLPFQS